MGEVVAGFWGGVRAGLSVGDAAGGVGVSARTGWRWFAQAGGVAPRCRQQSGRYLSAAEREIIDELWADPTVSKAAIARLLGRHRSTIGRELARNQTVRRAPRPPLTDRRRRKPGPRPGGLARHERLRATVSSLQESLDYLRLSIKYLVFDLEATRRDNGYLRKMLEDGTSG